MRNALLITGLLLSVVVFGSVFFPWLRMEMVPVKGIHLPELAKENYGPDHWLVLVTYLVILLPAISALIFWQLIVLGKLKVSWWLLVPLALLGTGISVFILVYQFDDSMNIRMELGAWFGWMACLGLLVWQGFVRPTFNFFQSGKENTI